MRDINPENECSWAVVSLDYDGERSFDWFYSEAEAREYARDSATRWDSVYVVRALQHGGRCHT